MNVDVTEQTRLTNNSATDTGPSFSPDGSKIAFRSERDGIHEIYVMNVDGTEQIRLTNNSAYDNWPSFSPITEATSAAATASAPDYNIGDTGPAGGLIFYINPNYETDGWHYLEAAPSDIPVVGHNYIISWDYRDFEDLVETGATATAIGTGMSNTQKIVDILGEGSYAAKLCDDYVFASVYDDWFLPSKDELNLMYENLHLNGIGRFEQDDYWSSSEIDEIGAWYQYFAGGKQGFSKKDYNIRVRAVRAFN